MSEAKSSKELVLETAKMLKEKAEKEGDLRAVKEHQKVIDLCNQTELKALKAEWVRRLTGGVIMSTILAGLVFATFMGMF